MFCSIRMQTLSPAAITLKASYSLSPFMMTESIFKSWCECSSVLIPISLVFGCWVLIPISFVICNVLGFWRIVARIFPSSCKTSISSIFSSTSCGSAESPSCWGAESRRESLLSLWALSTSFVLSHMWTWFRAYVRPRFFHFMVPLHFFSRWNHSMLINESVKQWKTILLKMSNSSQHRRWLVCWNVSFKWIAFLPLGITKGGLGWSQSRNISCLDVIVLLWWNNLNLSSYQFQPARHTLPLVSTPPLPGYSPIPMYYAARFRRDMKLPYLWGSFGPGPILLFFLFKSRSTAGLPAGALILFLTPSMSRNCPVAVNNTAWVRRHMKLPVLMGTFWSRILFQAKWMTNKCKW